MPAAKQKPSEIAAEAKRSFLPHISQKYPQFPARSTLCTDMATGKGHQRHAPAKKLRVAVIEGDPVDVALDWHDSNCKETTARSSIAGSSIAVVNMANEKRPGGDWESSLIAPEECLCRRSTLSQALATPSSQSPKAAHYPLGPTTGIYCPFVVVFRAGPSKNYTVWKEPRSLPIIAVAPVRRPKLDESGAQYSFKQERELMKEKMRLILRISMARGHQEICMGAFGCGYGFRNPPAQVARMWKDLLFGESEFEGAFANVVFAIEKTSGNGASGSSGNGSSSSANSGAQGSELEIFKREFAPSNVIKTSFR